MWLAGEGPPLRRTSLGRSSDMSEQRLRPSYRILAGLLAAGFTAFAAWITLRRPVTDIRVMLSAPTAMFAATCLYCAIFGTLPRIGGWPRR